MYARPLRSPYQVMVVDDHKFVAEILAQRLTTDGNIKVVAIANFGSTALHLIDQHDIDIVLLDMELDQEDGIGVAKQLLERKPGLQIIGLSMHDSDYHPVALLEIGGMGFISKRASAKEISDAVRRVAGGELAVSPQIAVNLATNFSGAGPLEKIKRLTTKEVEVLGDIARGLSVKQIAQSSGLTEKTIQTHRNSMRKKTRSDHQCPIVPYRDQGRLSRHPPSTSVGINYSELLRNAYVADRLRIAGAGDDTSPPQRTPGFYGGAGFGDPVHVLSIPHGA
ncbi:MAG: response regulator transcription factor [Gammaproteobacteria bacterium]|nr:response regulator transcription factor [Gammaproteobacteria bacterium]